MSTFQTHEELRPYAMGRSADVRQPIGKPVTLRPGRFLGLRFEEGVPVHTHHSCTIQQSLLADVLMPVNEKPGRMCTNVMGQASEALMHIVVDLMHALR